MPDVFDSIDTKPSKAGGDVFDQIDTAGTSKPMSAADIRQRDHTPVMQMGRDGQMHDTWHANIPEYLEDKFGSDSVIGKVAHGFNAFKDYIPSDEAVAGGGIPGAAGVKVPMNVGAVAKRVGSTVATVGGGMAATEGLKKLGVPSEIATVLGMMVSGAIGKRSSSGLIHSSISDEDAYTIFKEKYGRDPMPGRERLEARAVGKEVAKAAAKLHNQELIKGDASKLNEFIGPANKRAPVWDGVGPQPQGSAPVTEGPIEQPGFKAREKAPPPVEPAPRSPAWKAATGGSPSSGSPVPEGPIPQPGFRTRPVPAALPEPAKRVPMWKNGNYGPQSQGELPGPEGPIAQPQFKAREVNPVQAANNAVSDIAGTEPTPPAPSGTSSMARVGNQYVKPDYKVQNPVAGEYPRVDSLRGLHANAKNVGVDPKGVKQEAMDMYGKSASQLTIKEIQRLAEHIMNKYTPTPGQN